MIDRRKEKGERAGGYIEKRESTRKERSAREREGKKDEEMEGRVSGWVRMYRKRGG